MKSIHEALEQGVSDTLDEIDPVFLDAIAGGSGGQECCVNPTLTLVPNGSGYNVYTDCTDFQSC